MGGATGRSLAAGPIPGATSWKEYPARRLNSASPGKWLSAERYSITWPGIKLLETARKSAHAVATGCDRQPSRCARSVRCASRRLARQQQELPHHFGCQKRRHPADIVWRAHRVHLEADEAQPSQRADQPRALARRCAAPGRRAHARCTGRIEEVHVKAEIDRPLHQTPMQLGHHIRKPAVEQVLPRDQPIALLASELEDPVCKDRPTRSHVIGSRGITAASPQSTSPCAATGSKSSCGGL